MVSNTKKSPAAKTPGRRSSTTKSPATKSPAAKAPAPKSSSLAHVLKGTGGDLTASMKGWAGVVRVVPSSFRAPTKLVEQYFDVREQSLARRRRLTLELVAAAPKVRLPRRGRDTHEPVVDTA